MKIFLIGFMGSGKTHWGKKLSEKLDLAFFDLDAEIEKREHRSIPEIFSTHGEEYFRMKEKEILETLVEENPSMVLSCGGGTPCFLNNIKTMKKNGVVIWLNTHIEVLMQRLFMEKDQRPLLRNISDADLKSYIVRKVNERRIYYEQADVVVDNENNITVDGFVENILHA